jgi:hypothetical protein
VSQCAVLQASAQRFLVLLPLLLVQHRLRQQQQQQDLLAAPGEEEEEEVSSRSPGLALAMYSDASGNQLWW